MTDGVDLFVAAYGSGTGTSGIPEDADMVSVSMPGQATMREVVEAYLRRVEKDKEGVMRLYPFTRKASLTSPSDLAKHPKLVVIDPRISFGRPVIAGTNIRTSVVAERYLAGESIGDLARDYGRPTDAIEEAIRCEIPAAA
jgi:uncharacterized protein (DUF433 family)